LAVNRFNHNRVALTKKIRRRPHDAPILVAARTIVTACLFAHIAREVPSLPDRFL